jgi:hypothetical protein
MRSDQYWDAHLLECWCGVATVGLFLISLSMKVEEPLHLIFSDELMEKWVLGTISCMVQRLTWTAGTAVYRGSSSERGRPSMHYKAAGFRKRERRELVAQV